MKRVLEYLPAAIALVACLVLAPVLAITMAPVDETEPVVVVAGPGVDLVQLVEASGGWVIGFEDAPFGVLGFSDEPGFEERLRDNGAWAVLDGQTVAGFCGVRT
ncbi:hypothetical protein BXY66_2618 [Shimia isoporae]|uniref:Uncharacterized protein n=1 Tax=Shimia isoporae TaxID=647720 RepID=A0A4R1N423_9RHOB|nr:hypothetical protein [Shimia isoporae]TCL01305.1 hypothetical protein BXY66_2618 [Shimia isoporae]